MHIFAVVANSAGCERTFSNFGITHTKLRNKLDALRVHKTAIIRMEQQRVDREAGLARNRKKRKFGEEDTMSTHLPPSNANSLPDSESMEFHQYAMNLIQRAEASSDDNNIASQSTSPADSNSHQHPRTQTIPASSSRKTQIPLANLFDYTLSAEEGLAFYWPGSKKNMEADLLAHEQALADEVTADTS
jgi:hypothetical protein